MSLVEVHSRLGNTALFFTIIMAVWGFWRYFRRQGVGGSYWGAIVIAEILYFIQGALGAYLFFSGLGNLTGKTIHILYGVVSVLVAPAVFGVTRGDEGRRSMLVYAAGFLFLVGIILRGISTAS
jgi:hypothetical protein